MMSDSVVMRPKGPGGLYLTFPNAREALVGLRRIADRMDSWREYHGHRAMHLIDGPEATEQRNLAGNYAECVSSILGAVQAIEAAR